MWRSRDCGFFQLLCSIQSWVYKQFCTFGPIYGRHIKWPPPQTLIYCLDVSMSGIKGSGTAMMLLLCAEVKTKREIQAIGAVCTQAKQEGHGVKSLRNNFLNSNDFDINIIVPYKSTWQLCHG